MRKWPAALLLAALAAGCAAPPLQLALDELVAAEALFGGRVGVVVADAATGQVLVEHMGHRGFATASNMKLLSSAVALDTLGPEFTFATELVQRGEVTDGVLQGDLVLRGYGDPTFGEDDAGLDAMVAAVQAAGIRKIDGVVRGDGSYLGGEVRGHGWQWDYLEAGYAAPFGGLCFAGNTVEIRVRPQAGLRHVAGYRPRSVVPPDSAIELGELGSAVDLHVARDLGSDVIRISGRLPSDAAEQVLRVAVHDPARFAANALAHRLRAAGLEFEPGAHIFAEDEGRDRVLHRHRSPPLATIVQPLLTNSNNLYAEQCFRVAARHATGVGSTRAAEQHTVAFLACAGIDTQGMVLADGSGLSRRNLVQPHQLAELLLWVHGSPLRQSFVSGLPIAGQAGTLKSRFPEGSKARGRVRAKTGFISRVVCLSGYVPRPDPAADPLVFSVMLNDFTCSTGAAKAACDAFVDELCSFAGW